MSSRRHFLAGSAAAAVGLAALPQAVQPAQAAAGAAAAGATAGAEGPPNLVVILADDLGYGDLGAYGQKLITTPRIDQLAAEGLRFTDAYSAAAVCAPSRAALLTGLHTGHAAVRANPSSGGQGSLGAGDTTFAEVLRARGYRTGLFGKWGFGPEAGDQPSHPSARGFEEFYGYIDHSHAHEYYPAYLWNGNAKETVPTGTFAPDAIAARALDFIDAHAAGPAPFLLFLTPNLPHAPSEIPDASAYADRSWTQANKSHAAQISLLDAQVGAVVDRLKARGVAERTVVLVASDNGPHEEGGVNPDLFDANGPLRGYKRNLYEGGVRVPLVAWSPGRIAPGTTSARPTPLYDLLPTLADLAGAAPAPADIDGLSAAAVLNGAPTLAPLHNHLYWYRDEQGVTSRANTQDGGRAKQVAEAIRKDRWKAVRFAPARDRTVADSKWEFELYDLAVDLGEKNDVAAKNPSVVSSLTALLRSSWADTYVRRPWGLTAVADAVASTLTTTVANGTTRPWPDVRVTLPLPSGWTAAATTPTTALSLGPGESLTTTWRLTPPSTVPAPVLLVPQATTSSSLGFTAPTRYTPLPAPPTQDSYLSDLPWVSAANGWGPVEIDRSNGKQAAGDGTPIAFGGVTYAKGLGVHAPSEIVYHLGGRGNRFTTLVGIDDFSKKQSASGATRATVRGDGRVLATTGVLTGASGPTALDVDVTGIRLLHLVVEDANANSAFDHTSWAAARVTVV
ncbi:sulfatase-like hydrolase/transferase [Streptomyces sp. ZAF1911]|uniref:sulfatase-like hydrolase/transferase n=1 Tax=Streptomyces sp. ZAF1911 TaxID=2944129 RepID=UPI00237B9991|nr:sulfatase-like hydrolase/transferase [Streptomyces sp. ZAF1911]MDD9378458.1 sulfatase-like hydrolase/transferase [Streptomyces sp. ZAF1911]